MERLLLIATGMGLALLADWMLRWWRQAEDARLHAEANQVLQANGLTAYRYLASFGLEDMRLRAALDRLAFTGHVVLDKAGVVVGRLLPKVEKGPHLRLIIDNTKPN